MLLAFLVVFILMAKYGFPVITKMVEDRKNYIDESLKSAREANEKQANNKVERQAIHTKAREKQAQIHNHAMATLTQILHEAREKAQAEGQKLLNEAKAQISVEKENALRDIRRTVAGLSVQIAEKIVRRQLDTDDEQEKFIGKMLDEVLPSK